MYHTDEMVHGFTMVKSAVGKFEAFVTGIQDFEPVEDAYIVAGNYDIIVEIEADEVYDVLRLVSSDIQGIKGVTDTKTYIALD